MLRRLVGSEMCIRDRYYIEFFEKEGELWYLDSNKYLKEEVEELSQFLDSLTAT